MAEEEKPAEESAGGPPKAKSKLPLIAGGVAVVLLLGGGGTFFVLRKSDAPREESAEHEAQTHADDEHGEAASEEHADGAESHEETSGGHGGEASEDEHGGAEPDEGGGEHGGPPAPQFVSVDSFVVNINDGERDRFLKLKIDLEVSNAEVVKELEQRMPQVKDIMIGLLSSQSFAAIRSMEGKDALREQVQTRINAVVRTGVVKQVLFTEFVVQ